MEPGGLYGMSLSSYAVFRVFCSSGEKILLSNVQIWSGKGAVQIFVTPTSTHATRYKLAESILSLYQTDTDYSFVRIPRSAEVIEVGGVPGTPFRLVRWHSKLLQVFDVDLKERCYRSTPELTSSMWRTALQPRQHIEVVVPVELA
jgi:hypothetical protein